MRGKVNCCSDLFVESNFRYFLPFHSPVCFSYRSQLMKIFRQNLSKSIVELVTNFFRRKLSSLLGTVHIEHNGFTSVLGVSILIFNTIAAGAGNTQIHNAMIHCVIHCYLQGIKFTDTQWGIRLENDSPPCF